MAATQAVAVHEVEFDSHDINLRLDVESHSAFIIDCGSLLLEEGWNLFYISGKAEVSSLTIDEQYTDFLAVHAEDTAQLPDELRGLDSEFFAEGNPLMVFFEFASEGEHRFAMSYRSEFHQDVGNMRFSREHVGGEVTGTILDQGAYLSPACYFYPQGKEATSRFLVTADIPAEWECVSDGNAMSDESRWGRKFQTWENPFESDGLMFMAGPYVVKTMNADGVDVRCYFFEADTSLFDDYLTSTVGYIKMYSELIGPYPYNQFSVVENFFPTGYGMPAWTLLGQQVLRLPFIRHTSLGHEVLHNWWGNSVYVDYDRGNWCEGSTVYGADYRYKLLQSPAAARDYRKNILKEYVSYVDEGNDFPIREFTSRSSPGTRTIGYGKAMMVFHMIEEEIGTTPFFDSWKRVYQEYREHRISWEEWIKTFGEVSGVDMSSVIPQWIDRPGAPSLAVEVESTNVESDDALTVKFALSETSGLDYRLKVPVRFTGPDIVLDTSVLLISTEENFSLSVPAGITTLEVDPDYHLFRRLYPEEIEPIISGVLGSDNLRFVSTSEEDSVTDMFLQFGENFTQDSVIVEGPDILEYDSRDFTPIILNPADLPDYLVGLISVGKETVLVDDTEFSLAGHTCILTAEKFRGFEKCLVILTSDFESLSRLGQLVPHYGKYSYLVFEGSRNVAKGQWPAKNSPLRVELFD